METTLKVLLAATTKFTTGWTTQIENRELAAYVFDRPTVKEDTIS